MCRLNNDVYLAKVVVAALTVDDQPLDNECDVNMFNYLVPRRQAAGED